MTDRPKLPRVRPEDLEDGRFYYVTCKEMPYVCPTVGHFKDGDLWLCGWDVDEDPRSVDGIWGPIPEFELEGE